MSYLVIMIIRMVLLLFGAVGIFASVLAWIIYTTEKLELDEKEVFEKRKARAFQWATAITVVTFVTWITYGNFAVR